MKFILELNFKLCPSCNLRRLKKSQEIKEILLSILKRKKNQVSVNCVITLVIKFILLQNCTAILLPNFRLEVECLKVFSIHLGPQCPSDVALAKQKVKIQQKRLQHFIYNIKGNTLNILEEKCS